MCFSFTCGQAHTGAKPDRRYGAQSAVREGFSNGWLSFIIIVITLAVLAIALITSVLDLRLEAQTSTLSSSLTTANQKLTYLALHDNLTKLPNRVLLDDRLNQAIQNAAREKGCFALMFIDLDGFKAVNDAYGHRIGDLLLFEVARRIEENIRVPDTIARVGGDEFVLLARVGEPADAATVADKLLTGIREPFQVAGHELRVSGSIGIAIYPGDGERATREDAAIVSAIVALGHTLNMSVVAEGVETAVQQEFLAGLGCDSMQGYLLGRPMPADLIDIMMQKIKALAEPASIPACV